MRLSRRASVTAAVVAAAALVAVAVTLGRDDGATTVAASASPSPSTTAASPSSTTSAAPASTSTTGATPTSTTRTVLATPTTATTLPRTLKLRKEEGTITLEVTVEPAYPRAGELVQFHVEATDTDGGWIAFGFDPGDRRLVAEPGAPAAACVAPDPDAPPKERSSAMRRSSFDYVYRVAAERRFSVMVATGDCARAPHYAELNGTITVLPGVTTSNGPRVPEGSVSENPEGAPPSGVWMSVGASDRDGVVRRVSVDWGDGSEPSILEVPQGEYACVDEPTAYPSSGGTHSLEHVYETAGSYTVTATLVSTGCDGQNAQSVSVTSTAKIEPQSA